MVIIIADGAGIASLFVKNLFTIRLVFGVAAKRPFALLHTMFTGCAAHEALGANSGFDSFSTFHAHSIAHRVGHPQTHPQKVIHRLFTGRRGPTGTPEF
jgi:hypothetical protein